MNKQELRKQYLEKRKQLKLDQCGFYSLDISRNFGSLPFLNTIRILHTYMPIWKNQEPDTRLIVERLRNFFPHIRISVPKMKADGSLENFFFEGYDQLKTNEFGIEEPQRGTPTLTEQIDLVIVPLLAFDKTGHRIGYGKGYYDRFLAGCRKDCKKVGLSFFEPVDTIDDAGPTDVRLDLCVTPAGVINF